MGYIVYIVLKNIIPTLVNDKLALIKVVARRQ